MPKRGQSGAQALGAMAVGACAVGAAAVGGFAIGRLAIGRVAAVGRVDHAIRVTFESTRDAWIHPASHCAGDTLDRCAPAMGTRLRLRPSYDLGRFDGPARAIAAALKRYGLIVADNGSNWFFGGASDQRWDDDNLNQLKRIPGSAFQVVRSAARPHICR